MNIKTVMGALLCVVMSQLSLATSFTVYYNGSKQDSLRRPLCDKGQNPTIFVRPMWTNGPKEFFQLYCPDENYMKYVKTTYNRYASSQVDYSTVLHKLRGIEWKADNKCYYLDLEKFDISRVNIKARIYLYHDGTCGIDIDGKGKVTYLTSVPGGCKD